MQAVLLRVIARVPEFVMHYAWPRMFREAFVQIMMGYAMSPAQMRQIGTDLATVYAEGFDASNLAADSPERALLVIVATWLDEIGITAGNREGMPPLLVALGNKILTDPAFQDATV